MIRGKAVAAGDLDAGVVGARVEFGVDAGCGARGGCGGRGRGPRQYSGKHHHHGLRFLALTDEKGRLIWISAARPGLTHDTTAARHDHILAHLHAVGVGALVDLGFRGLDSDARAP
ncbi:transposase family protein [Streptomyces sp. NPDC004629]|uniref:transposase family protein n=1 Tax=Streptomyces sp. NPDC004629 TaxID=3364705 RepID=UPI0036B15CB0